MAAPLQYLLITVKVVALEKVFLIIHQILRLFLNRLTVDDKHYLFNRDNLAQPIHMGLSEKQKTFSPFFFCIFKIYIKSSTFAKKRMTLIGHVFLEIPAQKNMVR